MITNIISIISLILILFYLYYKIKYPFWSIQPVFHYHNIKYWLYPPGIIQHTLPKINKFFDKRVYFDTVENLSTEKKALFTTLIKTHYLPSKNENYKPDTAAIMEYFNNHNNKSYISLLIEHFFFENKPKRRVIASMTTRPLKCIIGEKELDLYYVDFLCVHGQWRKKGIAPKTIYTHYYHNRRVCDNTIFLFKREGASTAIVPLTTYKNYFFSLKYLKKQRSLTSPILKSILLSDTSMRLFFDILRLIKKSYKCYIAPVYSHIKNLIAKELLHICLVVETREAKACYIFRNSYTYYDGKRSVECIASFNNGLDESNFYEGFEDALVLLKQKNNYEVLFIENISDNHNHIKYTMRNHKLLGDTSGAYYFYNFGYRPFLSKDVFLLN